MPVPSEVLSSEGTASMAESEVVEVVEVVAEMKVSYTCLGEMPLFSELPAESLAILEPLAVKKAFKAGENVISFGDSGDLFYMILSGTARVFREPGIHLVDRHAGEWFGGKLT